MKGEIAYEELSGELTKAIAAVLARLPQGDCGPCVFNGAIFGHLLNAGYPETATGFALKLGEGLSWQDIPAGLRKGE